MMKKMDSPMKSSGNPMSKGPIPQRKALAAGMPVDTGAGGKGGVRQKP